MNKPSVAEIDHQIAHHVEQLRILHAQRIAALEEEIQTSRSQIQGLTHGKVQPTPPAQSTRAARNAAAKRSKKKHGLEAGVHRWSNCHPG